MILGGSVGRLGGLDEGRSELSGFRSLDRSAEIGAVDGAVSVEIVDVEGEALAGLARGGLKLDLELVDRAVVGILERRAVIVPARADGGVTVPAGLGEADDVVAVLLVGGSEVYGDSLGGAAEAEADGARKGLVAHVDYLKLEAELVGHINVAERRKTVDKNVLSPLVILVGSRHGAGITAVVIAGGGNGDVEDRVTFVVLLEHPVGPVFIIGVGRDIAHCAVTDLLGHTVHLRGRVLIEAGQRHFYVVGSRRREDDESASHCEQHSNRKQYAE